MNLINLSVAIEEATKAIDIVMVIKKKKKKKFVRLPICDGEN